MRTYFWKFLILEVTDVIDEQFTVLQTDQPIVYHLTISIIFVTFSRAIRTRFFLLNILI